MLLLTLKSAMCNYPIVYKRKQTRFVNLVEAQKNVSQAQTLGAK